MSQTGLLATLRTRLEVAPDSQVPRRTTNWQVLALLRFFLTSIVLCGHLIWYSADPVPWANALDMFGGKAAVIGFLLVSGYSIAASLARNQGGFYKRRILRIYPLYFFAILMAVSLEATSSGNIPLPSGPAVEATGWLTAIGNFLLLQTFVVKPVGFDGPVWSLSVEFFFYMLAPLFMRLRRGPLLALIAFSATCYMLPPHEDWGPVYFVLSKLNALRYLWCWLLGLLLYRDRSALTLAATALGSALIVLGQHTPEPLCFVTYLISAALLLTNERMKLPRSMDATSDYLGELSYPLYLYHVPSFILAYAFLGIREPVLMVLLALIVTGIALHTIDRGLKRNVLDPLVLGPRPARPILQPTEARPAQE